MRLAMHAPTARRTSLRHYPAESRSPTDCRFARGGVDELRRRRLHPAAHRHVIDGVLLAHSTQPSQPGGSGLAMDRSLEEALNAFEILFDWRPAAAGR
jgi:hypothetical protein